MNSEDFIIKLNSMLPAEFEAKKFDGMPRIHIKYNHYGFAVIDLKRDSYNLAVLEGLFSAVGIQEFEHISNMRNKTNRIRCVLRRPVATSAFASGHPALPVAGVNQPLFVQS